MNKENLLRMAEFIVTIPETNFDIRFWDKDISDEERNECGSICCVVGHCVSLDTRTNLLEIYGDKDIDGQTIFDHRQWSYDFTNLHGYEWDWCFSANWYSVDNTPIGASKRIKYLLKDGLPSHWGRDRYTPDIVKLYQNME